MKVSCCTFKSCHIIKNIVSKKNSVLYLEYNIMASNQLLRRDLLIQVNFTTSILTI